MERLKYLVLAPLLGAAGPSAGTWLVEARHAAEAVTAARARCLRPGDYAWGLSCAAALQNVEDTIRKGV